jgi:hypothetical protein
MFNKIIASVRDVLVYQAGIIVNKTDPEPKKSVMEMVMLKNGATVAKPIALVVMLSLKTLLEKDPISFYELVMKCRDSKHSLWGGVDKKLQELKLLASDGNVDRSIKDIVLSAVTGVDFDMRLGSPVVVSQAVETPSRNMNFGEAKVSYQRPSYYSDGDGKLEIQVGDSLEQHAIRFSNLYFSKPQLDTLCLVLTQQAGKAVNQEEADRNVAEVVKFFKGELVNLRGGDSESQNQHVFDSLIAKFP